MASMLPPIPAIARAAPATASGGTGRPSTITWCGRPAGRSGSGSDADSTSTPTPMAADTSPATPDRKPRSAFSSAGGTSPSASPPTTTPRTRMPCTTPCSTSSTSTAGAPSPGAARSEKSRAVTPGRSAPLTVSSARGAGTEGTTGGRGVGSSGTAVIVPHRRGRSRRRPWTAVPRPDGHSHTYGAVMQESGTAPSDGRPADREGRRGGEDRRGGEGRPPAHPSQARGGALEGASLRGYVGSGSFGP